MTVLWVNLAVVFLLAFAARYFSVIVGAGTVYIKPNKLLVLMALISLVLVSGLRVNIGDTFYYMHAYATGDFSWVSIVTQKDIGFNILQMTLKEISDDPQLMVFVTSFITLVLIVLVLYRYSRLVDLSLYIFITSGAFVTSMNGIRQYLAAAFTFAATRFLLEGSFKKYALVVLVASTIHQSALVLLPIYFFVRRKAWTGATFILLAGAVLLVIGFNSFSELLFTAIEDSQYGHYSDFAEGGANIIRVAVEAVPLIIAYLGRDRLRVIFPQSDVIVNLSIMGLVLMTIATQNWIFARVGIYFGLYQIVLISWIVKLFRDKDQKLVYYAILILYLLYFFYENVITLNLIYKSDYLIF